MPKFVTYPLVLYHPASKRSAGPEAELKKGEGFHTEPDRFPSVTVENRDQEELYLAQGYTRATFDEEAFDQAMNAVQPVGFVYAEFPRVVYHVSGEWKEVQSKEELDALGAGWGLKPGGSPDSIATTVSQAVPQAVTDLI